MSAPAITVAPPFPKNATSIVYHDGGDPIEVPVCAVDTPKTVARALVAAIVRRDDRLASRKVGGT